MPLDAAVNECVATQPAAADPACIRVEPPRWAVLATYPQAEAWAESNLRQRGYTPFLPRYTARIRDRTVPTLVRTVIRPLFAGYIFCQHDPRDPWRPIRYCPGIRANLIGGLGVQYARAGDVEAVRAAQELLRTPTTPETLYRPGAACSAILGGGGKVDGVVISVSGKKATLSAIMFGELREMAVEIANLRLRDE